MAGVSKTPSSPPGARLWSTFANNSPLKASSSVQMSHKPPEAAKFRLLPAGISSKPLSSSNRHSKLLPVPLPLPAVGATLGNPSDSQ